jgi:hypothetical protein
MNKQEEEEEEKQNQKEIKDMKLFIDKLYIGVKGNKDVASVNIFKRYFLYIILSIIIFFMFLFFIIKNILFLQFKKIKWQLKKLDIVDKAIKDILQI